MAKLSKPPADKDQVRRLYLSGLSTRQVAEQVGLSSTYVSDICRDIARDRSTAAQLRQPMQPSTNPRTCRDQARMLTERELGRKLETWEEVHHKDGDYTNQQKDNREVLPSLDHHHVHQPPNLIPRHLRPARQAYMKRYLHEYAKKHRAET